MKRILFYIFPILIIVTIVFAIFGVIQVRLQEERLMDDLKRKAKNVAESMELSARQVFINSDIKTAQRLADKFQKRERLQGSIFYNKDGKILAITERISELTQKDEAYVNELLISKTPRDKLIKFKEYFLYSYALPITDDDNNALGLVEVVYDTSYVFPEPGRYVETNKHYLDSSCNFDSGNNSFTAKTNIFYPG